MLVYEMNEEDRQAAMRAFEQAHKAKPDLGFAPDRAWIEGWAFAQHPSQSAGEPVGVVHEVFVLAEGKTSAQAELYAPLPGGTLLYASPPPTDAARASDEVNMRRRAFIQGWDERGKAYGLHGSVESDAAMKSLMDIYHPRIAPAEPADARASGEAAAIMHEVEKFVGELDAQHRPSGSVIRLGLLPRIRQLIGRPYSIDVDPGGIRARVADAITGALACGAQGTSPPPDGHWLAPFWESARAERSVAARDRKLEPLDYCTDPNNCARCKTHPNHRGRMQHAGIGEYPWDYAEPDAARADMGNPISEAARVEADRREPMTKQQRDAMFAEVQRRANQLMDDGRYSFGGWFPIAVELIEAHYGIRPAGGEQS